MWQIDNRTPFAAAQGWLRDRDGAETWVVVVKATFDISQDGSTSLASEQAPVLRLPEYHGEPGKSSPRFESDLVLTKLTTDIVVAGHACASSPVAILDVALGIGRTRKLLKVFGDREWRRSSPSQPERFVRMPLMFERSFGGVDSKSQSPDRDWDWR